MDYSSWGQSELIAELVRRDTECPSEPHYQLVDWEVTGQANGQPVQTLFANCWHCGMKTAIKRSTQLSN